MNQIELLSPAKDLETGIAAINCGADAVYIGPSKYGARKAAGNSLQDIQQLVNYAHKYWARVYVTVNTLLYDRELAAAERLIKDLYNTGVDAVIIQDTGLLELDLPPIPLFASTQMHNHAPDRVAFLEKVGIQRVILARELSLDQIKEIRQQTNIELETFIHGALCVSYSGQCYMSYAIGGRSGNRGQCAQPCRLKYSLVDANGNLIADKRFLLSLRDLNLSHSLGELVDAGVCSFKIEGRLKNKAYVMNVVGYYRQLLDHILNERGIRASSSGKVKLDFSPNPSKTFNRGYTTFFLHGRDKNITSMDTPKSTGEPLGVVDSISKGSIKLKNADVQLHPGDGLCYFDVHHEIMGTYVNAVNAKGFRVDQPQGLRPGTPLFRNFDHDFLSQVNKSHPKRKIQVDFKIEKTIEGIKLIAKDEDGCYAEIALTTRLATADAPDKSLKIINRQLKKLGSTAFSCTKVECDISPIPFFPVSTLNKLRRSVIENLAESRKQNFPRWHHKIVPNNEPYPKNQLSFEANVLNKKAETFYRRHGVQVIDQAAEAHHEMTGRKVMTTKHCLRYEFNACPRQKKAETPALPWTLIDEHGNEFPLRFNCAYCEMEVYFRKLPE